ncbi:MAG: hypothetical protein U1E23_05080 [Reyranellaceae bacterium]
MGGAGLLAAAPAAAQWNGPLWVGVPQHVSTETGVAFFYASDAAAVGRIARSMSDAAARCDRAAYDQALASAATLKANLQTDSQQRAANQYEPLQQRKDAEMVDPALQKAPRLAASCPPAATAAATPPATSGLALKDYGAFGPVQVYAMGGALVPLGTSGSLTSVNVSGGGVANAGGGGVSAAGMAGARVRAEVPLARRTDAPSLFFETGVQFGFGIRTFLQSVSRAGPGPQAWGWQTVGNAVQVPILAGVSFALSEVTPGAPVWFDLYGGITLDSWTQNLQGVEGSGPGFFSQAQRFTVDPTVGGGFRVPLSPGIAPFPMILRAGAEFQFRPGGVVMAQSGQFGGQTYWGTVSPTVNAAFMGGVGIPLGK